jgi:predicted enzyme related to lactoylglutathione lyase
MTADIKNVTFDCADPASLAAFWSAVTGYLEDPDDPNLPGQDMAGLEHPVHKGLVLLFQRVPEGKTVKNRVHLDVAPNDRSRDAEVERLTALGATLVADRRETDGRGWVVLADPEGNEFCVERSDREREESGDVQPGASY